MKLFQCGFERFLKVVIMPLVIEPDFSILIDDKDLLHGITVNPFTIFLITECYGFFIEKGIFQLLEIMLLKFFRAFSGIDIYNFSIRIFLC